MNSVLVAHCLLNGQHTAVFDADHSSHLPAERDRLLAALVFEARRAGLAIDRAALAFMEWNRPTFRGAADLVAHLAYYGLPGTWNRRLFLN